MSNSDLTYHVNSREWWNYYFANEWDANRGTEQTRHFMERLLANLPAPEAAYLGSNRVSILDWGCAFGEGVNLLGQTFPHSAVAGLDHAPNAIEEASRRYASYEFILAESGGIPKEFDVILTSNCLEHFEDPLAVIETHLRSCKRLYIAMVPYNESPLSEEHFFQFTEQSFPRRLQGFVRLHAGTVQVDPAFWNGEQLLVIYGSASYVRDRPAISDHETERDKWNRHYASLPLRGEDEPTHAFNAEFARRISELLPIDSAVLEAGCGAGWQSVALARLGTFDISLMDFSPEALTYAKRVFDQEGLSCTSMIGDVLVAGNPTYDLVFNAGSLEHYGFDGQVKFLQGMASRSRKYVLVMVPNRLCYWYWVWRLWQSANAQWPFGRETPVSDLSATFEAAGLHFCGQAFMGETWTEEFIDGLTGLTNGLREAILKIHRSPLLPSWQRSYLLAALGSVEPVEQVPEFWRQRPAVQATESIVAESQSVLADALALRIGSEIQIKQSEGKATALATQLAERDTIIRERDKAIGWLQDELNQSRPKTRHAPQSVQQLTKLSDELKIKVESLSADLAAAQEKTVTLEARLAEEGKKSEQLQTTERDMVEKQQELRSLRAMLLGASIGSVPGRVVEQSQLLQELAVEDETEPAAHRSISGQLAGKERQLAGEERSSAQPRKRKSISSAGVKPSSKL